MDVHCDADSQAFPTKLNLDDFKDLEIDHDIMGQLDATPITLINETETVTDDVSDSVIEDQNVDAQSLVYYIDNNEGFTIAENLSDGALIETMEGDEMSNRPVTVIVCQNEDGDTLEAHFVFQSGTPVAIKELEENLAEETNVVEDNPEISEKAERSETSVCLMERKELYIATTAALESEERVKVPRDPSERFACMLPGCTKSYKYSSSMEYHCMTHSGQRPHRCPHGKCGKTFLTSQRLKVHSLTHTGEKPYHCSQQGCDKSFTTNGNLRNHMRTHTGEKPFVCEVETCRKKFAESSSLKKHYSTHTGEKQFPCRECGRHFSQSSSRSEHIKHQHKKQTSNNADVAVTSENDVRLTSENDVRTVNVPASDKLRGSDGLVLVGNRSEQSRNPRSHNMEIDVS